MQETEVHIQRERLKMRRVMTTCVAQKSVFKNAEGVHASG